MSITANKRGRDEGIYELSFSDRDLVGIEVPHNDALVLTVNINTWDVKRVLVDPGSSSEIMYKNLYEKLQLPPTKIQAVDMPVFSFSGQPVWPVGTAKVPVRLGPITQEVEFFIIDIDAPYNAILGRNWLGAIRAVASLKEMYGYSFS